MCTVVWYRLKKFEIPGELLLQSYETGKPSLLPKPQVFHLLSGDKNAIFIKLFSELNAMADGKYSSSVHLSCPPQQTFYPANAQFTSSHIPWRRGRIFGNSLTGDYLFGLLVPVSDVTWQVSTQPYFHQSQLTGIIHKPVAWDFSLLIFLLRGMFTLLFTIKWSGGFKVVLSKSAASLKGHYLFSEGKLLSQVD